MSAPPPLPETPSRSFIVGGHVMAAANAAPGLHLVATPIGHLGDITLRALETLAGCDAIACEDTRITHRLLERYGIRTALTPYHDHNAAQARPRLLQRMQAGGAIALVSDAGTPLISDPGFKLVREARALGLPVTAAPGPSAVLAALSVAGLPTGRFYFEGFLPAKGGARAARIAELARIDATLVLFESGSRIAAALIDLAAGLGAREAALCRELTKLHEEVRRAPLPDLARDAGAGETRGEFVVVIAPPLPIAALDDAAIDAALRAALARGSVKDAAAEVAAVSGRPRREVYARALTLAAEPMSDGEG